MISVLNKRDVPASLAYPPTIGQPSETTHKRRGELITANSYIDTKIYSSRYKQNDTKIALRTCYHKKCAYCEQVVEATHVEHYRPKVSYWWLTYSWDNLLRVCPTCNEHKGDNFEISRTKVVYNPSDLPRIHTLRDIYNQAEIPSLLNPECDDLTDMWIFGRNGEMSSSNYRGNYTIETLKLDRDFLRDLRKDIIDDFENEALEVWIMYEDNPTKLEDALYSLIETFVRNSHNPKKSFIAYRTYAMVFVNQILIDFYS